MQIQHPVGRQDDSSANRQATCQDGLPQSEELTKEKSKAANEALSKHKPLQNHDSTGEKEILAPIPALTSQGPQSDSVPQGPRK